MFFTHIWHILFFFIALSASAQRSDEQQIREARLLHNRALADHDTVAISSFHTSDYHVISSRNFTIQGRDQNSYFLSREFKEKKGVVYVRASKSIEVFPEWSMAGENGVWSGQWQEADGLVKLSGTYYAKWHKINGQWKIRAEIFTPLRCSGSKFCNTEPRLE